VTATNDAPSRGAMLFTAAMTLAGGAAGLVFAGVVLGFDYLLRGEPDRREQEAERRAQQRRDRFEDALAWLAADRIDRERTRRAKREWFEADPATRGSAPASETLGRVAARAWYSTIVGAGRFRRGWQAGRTEAQQRRTAGDPDWWRVRRQATKAPETKPDLSADTTQPASRPQPEPATATHRPAPARRPDIVDAEIVPDPAETRHPSSDVVLADDRPVNLGVDGYADRIDSLRAEVDTGRGGGPADLSPPRSSL